MRFGAIAVTTAVIAASCAAVIGIARAAAGAVIRYDKWEDGYETDPPASN